jgi:hypothetical protein
MARAICHLHSASPSGSALHQIARPSLVFWRLVHNCNLWCSLPALNQTLYRLIPGRDNLANARAYRLMDHCAEHPSMIHSCKGLVFPFAACTVLGGFFDGLRESTVLPYATCMTARRLPGSAPTANRFTPTLRLRRAVNQTNPSACLSNTDSLHHEQLKTAPVASRKVLGSLH